MRAVEGGGAPPATNSKMIVHGHFYQPPRENPRTDEIDPQPSAAPWHDWNERVNAECYSPNVHVPLGAPEGEMVVSNFERLSFNMGPTLLQWMQKADPETYAAIIAADSAGISRLGHGNAIAQAYHHTILPLSPVRDIRTQVRWGQADFRHRFGRDPEGMWLPETAADDTTLAVLIEEGISFTILAPGQAGRPIDSRMPYRYMHQDGSGRSLALFFYDGEIAQAIAFENAGSSAEGFIDLFASKAGGGCLAVHAATDGETYGHHHRFSDIGLAYALFVEAETRDLYPTNYAAWLAECPPEHEVTVVKGGSSWSCGHGLGRWKENCGCSTGGQPGWNQEWRAPLREALDIVRQSADQVYERLGAEIFSDPWEARDRYIEVVLGAIDSTGFVAREAFGPLDEDKQAQGASLLEIQRNAMAMYTSCGWFFNDVGGIETLQVLRYAARVLELLEEVGGPVPEEEFLSTLGRAVSNDPALGTGADLFNALL